FVSALAGELDVHLDLDTVFFDARPRRLAKRWLTVRPDPAPGVPGSVGTGTVDAGSADAGPGGRLGLIAPAVPRTGVDGLGFAAESGATNGVGGLDGTASSGSAPDGIGSRDGAAGPDSAAVPGNAVASAGADIDIRSGYGATDTGDTDDLAQLFADL